MYKKATVFFVSTMLVSFVGMLVCLPLGIQDTLKRINTILSEYKAGVSTVYVDSNVKAISIDYGGYVAIEQSKNDTIYIENYTKDTFNPCEVIVNKTEDEMVKIQIFENYNTFIMLDKAKIEKSIAAEMQNHPDIIVYVTEDTIVKAPEYFRVNSGVSYIPWVEENAVASEADSAATPLIP